MEKGARFTESRKGGCRELQPGRPEFNAQEGTGQFIKSVLQPPEEDRLRTSRQHGFVKYKLCQIDLISFFDRITSWEDAGTAVDITSLDSSKAFDSPACSSHKGL